MSVIQNILKIELEQIVSLQNKIRWFEPSLAFLSTFLGPSTVFQYIIPFVGAFDSKLLVELILSGTVADSLGLGLKWMANEDRPFWWVRETDLYTDQDRPHLRQHPLTCESTSGSPSGHNIIATVFLYNICKHAGNHLQRRFNLDETKMWWMQMSMFVSTATVMWPIRMYFGCHFLHQCVLGSLVGFGVVKFLESPRIRQKLYDMGKGKSFVFATGLAASLTFIYLGLRLMGTDPHWSVKMAFKWCENPQFVAHESTPIYSVVKNFGTVCGLALAAPLRERQNTKLNRLRSVPCTVVFIIFNHLLLQRTPKNHGVFLFLGYSFLVSVLFTYSVVGIITKICRDHPKQE